MRIDLGLETSVFGFAAFIDYEESVFVIHFLCFFLFIDFSND